MNVIKPKTPKQLDKIGLSKIGIFMYYTATLRFYQSAAGDQAAAQPNWWNPITLAVISIFFILSPIFAMCSDETVKGVCGIIIDEFCSKVDKKYFPHII